MLWFLIGLWSPEPTYEELKLLFCPLQGFCKERPEPTYEELKHRAELFYFGSQRGPEPTYEELKLFVPI